MRWPRLSGEPLGGRKNVSWVERWDWLIFLIVGTAAVLMIRRELRLRGGGPTILAVVVANLPWIAAGAAKFLYPDRDSFDLLDLRLGRVAYLQIASVVAVWVALLNWLFLRNGAEELARSETVRKFLRLPQSASSIQLLALACVLGGILGLAAGVIAATGR